MIRVRLYISLFPNINLEIELSSNATNQIQSIAQMLEINDIKNRNIKNLNEMLIYQLGNSSLANANQDMLYSLYFSGYSALNYPNLFPGTNYLYPNVGEKPNQPFYGANIDINAFNNLRQEIKDNVAPQVNIQSVNKRPDETKKVLNTLQVASDNGSHLSTSKIETEDKIQTPSQHNSGKSNIIINKENRKKKSWK